MKGLPLPKTITCLFYQSAVYISPVYHSIDNLSTLLGVGRRDSQKALGNEFVLNLNK